MGRVVPQKPKCGGIQVIQAAVLGSPIKHSLSPFLHSAAYKYLNVDGDYYAIEMTAENIPVFLRSIDPLQWNGFSLTMPLKEVVVSLADRVDPICRRIQSGNTLIFDNEESVLFSTDYLAFHRILSQKSFQKVAVLGAGGTARAALGALDDLVDGIDVLIRSESRISALRQCAEKAELRFLPMESDLSGYDLVISTLPAGAADSLAERVVDPKGELFEVLYNPWPTSLVSVWQAAGQPIISGITLLIEQALDQIEFMTKAEFDYAQLRTHLITEASKLLPGRI